MLRTYAIAPETLRRLLWRSFWRFQLISTLSFLVFGVYLILFSHPVNWMVAGPILAGITLAYFLIIFINYRQQLRILYSVRYELDGSSIIYRQIGQDPLRIMRADITRVRERKTGLWVETVYPRIRLLITRGLSQEGDRDFMTTLQTWVGVEALPPFQRGEARWVLLPGAAAALLILLFANSLWIMVPLGIGLLLYSVVIDRRLGHPDDQVPGSARMYNMAFGFLFFVIIMKSCLLGITMALSR